MKRSRFLLIVTGLSGAGKTQVIRTLEDQGFYCVDNLPLELFDKFLELVEGAGDELGAKVALGLDLREGRLDERFPALYERLKESRFEWKIVFVEASNEVLIERFSATRRPHPLSPSGSVKAGIELEKRRLAGIRGLSGWIIDSTGLTVHQLRRKVERELPSLEAPRPFMVHVVSFGFSFGLPPEASLVLDVRFLPNPYFIPELRPLTGKDEQIYEFVCSSEEGKELIQRFEALLAFLVPKYRQEGKTYLTIAIGCTGGRHRSVALARHLAKTLGEDRELNVSLSHRELEKPI